MAQIDLDNIRKITKEHNTIHTKVNATYTVFDHNNEHYVQIDTYGKANRKEIGKLSQSIQLDRETALFLVNLLQNEFDLK